MKIIKIITLSTFVIIITVFILYVYYARRLDIYNLAFRAWVRPAFIGFEMFFGLIFIGGIIIMLYKKIVSTKNELLKLLNGIVITALVLISIGVFPFGLYAGRLFPTHEYIIEKDGKTMLLASNGFMDYVYVNYYDNYTSIIRNKEPIYKDSLTFLEFEKILKDNNLYQFQETQQWQEEQIR